MGDYCSAVLTGGGRTVLVSTDGINFTSAVSITVDQSNWDVDQTIYVKAATDGAEEGETEVFISHSVISNDTDIDGVVLPNVKVTVQDDDKAGLLIAESNESTAVVEGSQDDSYTVALTRAPAAGETVTVTLSHDADVQLSVTTLVFTDADWDQSQTVVVSGVDEGQRENTETAPISHTVTSSDPGFTVGDDTVVNVSAWPTPTAPAC